MKQVLAASAWIGASLTPLAAQPELVQYQLDDGSFEGRIDHPPEEALFGMEIAQRFTVARGGRLAELGVCVWRNERDSRGRHHVMFNVHRADGGRPGPGLIAYENAPVLFTEELPRNEYKCLKGELRFGFSVRFDFEPGEYWVSASLPGEGDLTVGTSPASLAADRNGPATTSVMNRFKSKGGTGDDVWTEWRPVSPQIRAVGIRFAIASDATDPDPAPDPDPPVVGVTHYQEDDGSFENDGRAADWDDSTSEGGFDLIEVAQRFEIKRDGRVRYLEACFERAADDPEPNHAFGFRIYESVGGLPLRALQQADDLRFTVQLPRGAVKCIRKELTTPLELTGTRQVDADPGVLWVAVSFSGKEGVRSKGLGQMVKRLAIDRSGPDFAGEGVRIAYRTRFRTTGATSFLEPSPEIARQAVGIRMGVEHGLPLPSGEGYTDCVPTTAPLSFDEHDVLLCYETPENVIGEGKAGIWTSEESGLLWFFDRGNAEVLVKVLDGCAINGHRWVFVAPVTDLAFNLYVVPPGKGEPWSHHNRKGRTAAAKSDTAAFPCGPSSAVDTRGGAGRAAPGDLATGVSLAAVGADGYTDCVPTTASLVFDGYQVRMCYETPDGTIGEGRAGIWASGQSGLLWFFNEGNAEVLIKVLDGCAINEQRWVFVGPVTDLAFNLYVVPPEGGEPWTHRNAQGRTANTRSDTSAFPCAPS